MTIMKVPPFNNGPNSIGSYLKYIFSKKDLLHYRQRCFEQIQRWNKSIQQDWPWLLFLLWKHFFRFLSHFLFHLKSLWERSSELQSLVEIPPVGVHVRIGWGRGVRVSVIVCVCCAGRSLDRGGYRWAVVVCDCHLKKQKVQTQICELFRNTNKTHKYANYLNYPYINICIRRSNAGDRLAESKGRGEETQTCTETWKMSVTFTFTISLSLFPLGL